MIEKLLGSSCAVIRLESGLVSGGAFKAVGIKGPVYLHVHRRFGYFIIDPYRGDIQSFVPTLKLVDSVTHTHTHT